MKLLAIDPASISSGIAVFDNGKLISTSRVFRPEKDPTKRRVEMAGDLECIITLEKFTVICEEPQIQGRNGNGMHRLLGMIEFITEGSVNFIHPLTVKKSLGSGSLDKMEVALAAGERLQTEEEKEILAEAISREAWDETDAVAIGLSWMEKNSK